MNKTRLTSLLFLYTHSDEEIKQYIRDQLVQEQVTVRELLDASDLLPLPEKMFLPIADLVDCVKRKGGSRSMERTFKIYELCPHCRREVQIPADQKSLCPSCGREILPCSTCYDHLPGFRDCNWSEENGCWRFPAAEKGD